VALTLRLLCGLSTADVARAFLIPEATIAARITRAKKKITAAHIPYRVPAATELRERLDGVLSVVYLVYTTGHTAPSGENLMRRDLAERGHELARMLRLLLPGDGDVA
ncbi:MAG TPA: RNA polymerase subunit sigma-24, partial [Arthrobacter bacterium]|nr:RNA polymerase subunit sigma-24 [Arthrobacter sp.]